MIKRELGRQGLRVSALGLGCRGMSDFCGGREEKQALQTIDRYPDSGMKMINL